MKTAWWALGLTLLFAPSAMAQTADDLANGAADTGNVLNYGMGYSLQRFSPLTQINKDTVKRLVRSGTTVLMTTRANSLSRSSTRA